MGARKPSRIDRGIAGAIVSLTKLFFNAFLMSLTMMSAAKAESTSSNDIWSCDITTVRDTYGLVGPPTNESAIMKVSGNKLIYSDSLTTSTSQVFQDPQLSHRSYTIILNDNISLVAQMISDNSVDSIIIDKKDGLFLEQLFEVGKNDSYNPNPGVPPENLPTGIFNDGQREFFSENLGYCFKVTN